MTGRRLLLSGAGLMALLVVVAVASRAHKPGGGTGGGGANVPNILLDYLGVFALFVIVFGGAIAVFTMADNRRKRALAGENHWSRTVVAILVVFGGLWLTLFVARHLHHAGARAGPQGAIGPVGGVAKGTTGRIHGPRAIPPQASDKWLGFAVLGAMVLGLAIAIITAVVYRRTHAVEMDEEAALAAALDAVLADTLADLYAERDPRAAVINAYARMEETFAAYRVPREEAETSLEYVERALDRLNVSGWAVRRLTLLFERAKFSAHEVDSTMKDDAIETLASVRAELEADRQAAA